VRCTPSTHVGCCRPYTASCKRSKRKHDNEGQKRKNRGWHVSLHVPFHVLIIRARPFARPIPQHALSTSTQCCALCAPCTMQGVVFTTHIVIFVVYICICIYVCIYAGNATSQICICIYVCIYMPEMQQASNTCSLHPFCLMHISFDARLLLRSVCTACAVYALCVQCMHCSVCTVLLRSVCTHLERYADVEKSFGTE
jgi:hypothetical protein